MNTVATFGIGSTNFRGAVATPAGEFRTDVRVEPTRPHALETQLCEAVAAFQAQAPVDAISITLPGLVEPAAGVVREFDTPDGEVLDPLDLRTPLAERFDVPVFLENDCSASALGELGSRSRTHSKNWRRPSSAGTRRASARRSPDSKGRYERQSRR